VTVPSPPKPLSEEDLVAFEKQTSFYWPEFQLPLKVTEEVVDRILKHYTLDEGFDYLKSGWVT